jgi:hypothetical protein
MHDEELDRILNEGLRAYTGVEPSPGLTARVLDGLPPRRARWRWWAGGPVLAGVFAMLLRVFVLNLQHETSKPPLTQVMGPVLSPAPVALPALAVVSHRARRMVPRWRPTPYRLTPEERELAQVAARHPELILDAFKDQPVAPLEPIQIAAVEFKPIEFSNQND